MFVRLMSKGEYVIVPKGTKFTGLGKLGLTFKIQFILTLFFHFFCFSSLFVFAELTCIPRCTHQSGLEKILRPSQKPLRQVTILQEFCTCRWNRKGLGRTWDCTHHIKSSQGSSFDMALVFGARGCKSESRQFQCSCENLVCLKFPWAIWTHC